MTRIKNSVAFILMLVVLAACNVSKDIEKPIAELPTNFRNAATEDKSSIADIEWKRFFTDASLQRLIDKAIAKNYDMQLAVKNIEASELLMKQTKWNYLPDARLQVTANSNRPSDNSLNGLSAKSFLNTTHVEDYSANIALSWEADIWGKIKNQKASALAAYLQTEEAKKAIQTNIVASVSQGFYNLLMLDAQIAIAKKNIALNDSTLRIIRLQFDAGQVTALAIQQAEAQQLTAAALVPQLEQNIEIQENALSILAGELPDSIQRNGLLSQVNVADSLSAGVPSEMVSRRPDVKSNELALDIANAQVGIARANMYPSLTITAGGGLNSFRTSNWFNIPASLFGAVAGGLAQPLFQKKQLTTAYDLARVNREKTVIEFRQSVLNAVGEVSDALVRIEKLQTEKSILLQRVNTLQKGISNANMLFKTGMANYLEVITAQSNVLQSELELASITREQLSAKVELYRSLGGGWK
ncbi:efflux transporter outer membrane subunit [Segetibacter aerophilus]|uniref:RND transporter n=1 Tax=Segetibacter aerophilus TaxID=670293 RepID=A0A512BAY7_9BACT|nr:efflux transporter outer membrane subunit [Segetibacter aerophilus]GEO09122.1 RND transporter [Segetibacter aerophilus]